MRIFAALFLISVILLASCSPSETSQKPAAPPVKEPPPSEAAAKNVQDTLKGVSLSPRSMAGADFTDFFLKATEAGEIITWAGDWNELEKEGGGPNVIASLSINYGYLPIINLSFQSNGKLLRPLDEPTKLQYKNSVVAFAEKHKPKYLGLGIEVNRLQKESPSDFEAFAGLYNEIYLVLKEKSPSTMVFTTFQLEEMKGHALWSTALPSPSAEQWDLLDKFPGEMAVFTSYPGLVYKDPADIPASYYTDISLHTNKRIAFVEIGWHSAASPAGWESSEEEQKLFTQRFLALTEKVKSEFLVWSFLYDPSAIEPFNSMGLLRNDGSSRPAWNAWLASK